MMLTEMKKFTPEAAYRGGLTPDDRYDSLGFRLVLLPGQEKASR